MHLGPVLSEPLFVNAPLLEQLLLMVACLLDLLLPCRHLGLMHQRAPVVRGGDPAKAVDEVFQVALSHDHAGDLRQTGAAD